MLNVKELYEIFLAHPAVCTDSRKAADGAVFFALKGDNFDGNRYADAALDNGASHAVVDDPAAAVSDRHILVDDVLATLQALARHHRRELGIPILAITGSNGKTTTKELVSRVLADKFDVATTRGNLNNHIGVPLTLLAMTRATQFGVVEMGANHRGEIALLCSIAEPDYGLITNIGKCHLEGFGGIEGVARGKGEMFDHLAANGGTAFYLSDSAELTEMARSRPGMKAIGYTAETLKVIASDDNLLSLKSGRTEINTNLAGDYNRFNIAAALAAGSFFGVPEEAAARAIERYVPDNARSQKKTSGSNIIYADYYNANPTSMAAALENFAAAVEPGRGKLLILGDMGELGEFAGAEHRAAIENAERLGFDRACLVGRVFSGVAKGGKYNVFADVAELCAHLKAHPVTGSAILIKGSRSAHLEETEPFLSN